MEYFKRYLQQHGDPDSCSRLENDLMFYLEVQKMKVSRKNCLEIFQKTLFVLLECFQVDNL